MVSATNQFERRRHGIFTSGSIFAIGLAERQ